MSFTAKSASIDEIEALLGLAEYGSAEKEIKDELKRKDLTSKVRAQLYWLKAICHLSESENALAKASLLNLLATDPFFEPEPDSSPKILDLFKLIAAQFREKGALERILRTSFAPLENINSGEPFTLQIKLEEKEHLIKGARLELHLRPLGKSEYSTLDFKPTEAAQAFEATIPAIFTKHFENDTNFEYYIEMVSENGNRLGTIGKSTLPLTFVVLAKPKNNSTTAQESRGNFWNAALWIGATTLTIGGAIALALVFSTPDEGSLRLKIYSPES